MEAVEALALVTGKVEEEILLRNEYLALENEILKSKLNGQIKLTNTERARLAKIGEKLGQKALAEIGCIVKPETIMAWYRKLIAQKFDGSKQRGPGKPSISEEVENLIVKFADDNPDWGNEKIEGALKNLGIFVSQKTIGRILAKHGFPITPERIDNNDWAEFIEPHKSVLAACDFFTKELLTPAGLITYYILFFILIDRREVYIAGVTTSPDEPWMKQIARNVTMDNWGFLFGCTDLILDRDSKFCNSFKYILKCGGITCKPTPPKSPNLNAFAERFVRSIKEECLSRLLVFNEDNLRVILHEYVSYYNQERNHQGLDNNLINPKDKNVGNSEGAIACRQRLGGLLKYYYRKTA